MINVKLSADDYYDLFLEYKESKTANELLTIDGFMLYLMLNTKVSTREYHYRIKDRFKKDKLTEDDIKMQRILHIIDLEIYERALTLGVNKAIPTGFINFYMANKFGWSNKTETKEVDGSFQRIEDGYKE